MTTEKFLNTYRFSKLSRVEIRGMLRDLDDPDMGIDRKEQAMRREALERLKREK